MSPSSNELADTIGPVAVKAQQVVDGILLLCIDLLSSCCLPLLSLLLFLFFFFFLVVPKAGMPHGPIVSVALLAQCFRFKIGRERRRYPHTLSPRVLHVVAVSGHSFRNGLLFELILRSIPEGQRKRPLPIQSPIDKIIIIRRFPI